MLNDKFLSHLCCECHIRAVPRPQIPCDGSVQRRQVQGERTSEDRYGDRTVSGVIKSESMAIAAVEHL